MEQDPREILARAAASGNLPPELRDWAGRRAAGGEDELEVPALTMEQLSGTQAQAMLNLARKLGAAFWEKACVDGDAARQKRIEMLAKLEEIDAAVYEAIADTAAFRCPGKRRAAKIQGRIRAAVFKIVFRVPEATVLVPMSLEIGELSGKCIMADVGDTVLITWWGGKGDPASLSILLDLLAAEEGDWFNGHAVFRVAKDYIVPVDGTMRFELRGLQCSVTEIVERYGQSTTHRGRSPTE
jgi:hypothetical protein